MGFLAPPCSVFLEARRTVISKMEFRIRLPGAASKYCFISRLENPFAPPK